MKWFGVGITLVLMPLLSAVGICGDWFRTGSHRPCDVPDFATGGRLRSTSTSARSSLHRLAARGQIQSQEPHRHIRLPLWRSNRCVVLSVNALVWLGTGRHFLGGSSAWSNLVRPRYLARVANSACWPTQNANKACRPQLRQKLPDLAEALTGASAWFPNRIALAATALSGVWQTILSARIAGTIACITNNNKGDKTMATRTGSAVWEGTLKEGRGTMKLGSGAFEGPFSFSSRFEEAARAQIRKNSSAQPRPDVSQWRSRSNLEKAGHPAKRESARPRQ